MDRILGAPFITGETHFATVAKDRFVVNDFNVTGGANFGAGGATVALIVNPNAFIGQGDQFPEAQIAVFILFGHSLQGDEACFL